MNRILLVDDEQNVLNALRRELKDIYDIETFDSPVDALSRSKQVAFDLVISDYQMPFMNGIEFLKQFGTIQPDAERLVLSGQADIDALISAINETHIYRFIAKPWNNTELRSCIEQALDFRKVILEGRRLANLYRQTRPPLVSGETEKKYRIVLVDSNNISLAVMRRGLIQDANYEGVRGAMRQEITQCKTVDHQGVKFVVDAFTNARVALEHVKHNICDLIITAQTLPDMPGTQLLGEIRKIRSDVACILIGSNPDMELLSQAINEIKVSSFLCLFWNTANPSANMAHMVLEVQQLKTAVVQALTSRDVLLENRRLAGLSG